MTEEEKLRDYLRKNAVEEEPKPKAPAPKINPAETTSMSKPFTHDIGIWTFRVLLFMFPIALVVSYTLHDVYKFDETETWTWTFVILGAYGLFWLMLWVIRFQMYNSWTKSEPYPLVGWDEFISKRTRDFWKKGVYTPITVTIKLKPGATPLHKQAAITFLDNWVNKWSYKFGNMDWKSNSRPNDYKITGTSISGDVGVYQVNILIVVLSRKFLPLSKLLGDHLESVTIKSDTKEVQYSRIKSRSNAHDRQVASGDF